MSIELNNPSERPESSVLPQKSVLIQIMSSFTRLSPTDPLLSQTCMANSNELIKQIKERSDISRTLLNGVIRENYFRLRALLQIDRDNTILNKPVIPADLIAFAASLGLSLDETTSGINAFIAFYRNNYREYPDIKSAGDTRYVLSKENPQVLIRPGSFPSTVTRIRPHERNIVTKLIGRLMNL